MLIIIGDSKTIQKDPFWEFIYSTIKELHLYIHAIELDGQIVLAEKFDLKISK